MKNKKKEPMYQKVENHIIDGIQNGKFKYNGKIPAENELCKLFGVSRMTVNKALTNLARAGYVERIPGKGSFVKSYRVERKIPEMISFSEELKRAGMKSSSKLLSYSIVDSQDVPVISKKLNIGKDELIHYFVRLRCGDKKPLAVSYNYVPVKMVPKLDINSLQSSFYNYLENILELDLGYNDTTIQVVKPSEEVEKILDIYDNSQVVKSSHISYLNNNEPFEYTNTFYIYNQYVFSYRCYRDTKAIENRL